MLDNKADADLMMIIQAQGERLDSLVVAAVSLTGSPISSAVRRQMLFVPCMQLRNDMRKIAVLDIKPENPPYYAERNPAEESA